MSNSNDDDKSLGTPLPDFRASGIQLQTVAPALGVAQSSPDYLDYDKGGRGVVVTLFANSGVAYLMGISAGGIYGVRQGLTATPSNRFRVQLNSVLNHCGRYGSRAGNTLGVVAVLYSLYEGLADYMEIDEQLGLRHYSNTAALMSSPLTAAAATGATFYSTAGPRAALLAGAMGAGAVGTTYAVYSVLGVPYGSRGFLFF